MATFGFVLTCLAVAGCGPRVVEHDGGDRGGENLIALRQAYDSTRDKLGRPPRSADELKKHAESGGDIDRILVSPNDNQPYVVVWGADLRKAGDPTTVVAYEKVGRDGVRYVLLSAGVVKLSAREFAEARFAAGHRPKP